MYLKLFASFILITSLVGCATTRHPDEMAGGGEQLQMRIGQLEEQLEQKDEEINDLKDEVQSLSDDVRRNGNTTGSRKVARSESSESSTKKEGFIRVNANPDQIQLALKNAGYYSGTVDGKIGDKTRKAIAEFQKAHNLTADGIVGKRTWDELKTYLE